MRTARRFKVRRCAGAAFVCLGLLAAAHAPTTLKEALKSDFLIGAAINTAQITGEDRRGDALVATQFDSIIAAKF